MPDFNNDIRSLTELYDYRNDTLLGGQRRSGLEQAGKIARHSAKSSGRQAMSTPHAHGNRRWPLTPPMDIESLDQRRSTPSDVTPGSNRSASIASVLPPDVEASLTCLLAAAKSFSTVITGYNIANLTEVQARKQTLTQDEDRYELLSPPAPLRSTRDLSLSNLYPSQLATNHVAPAESQGFNLLRSKSKQHMKGTHYNELEQLQYEINQSMEKCKADFKTALKPSILPSTSTYSVPVSRHFPDINFSISNSSILKDTSSFASNSRHGDISTLAGLVPVIILGLPDLTFAQKYAAVEQNATTKELCLSIYTFKTRTKLESISLTGMSVSRCSIDAVDVTELYCILPFDLNVIKGPDMTELINFKSANASTSTSFAVLLSALNSSLWFDVLKNILNN